MYQFASMERFSFYFKFDCAIVHEKISPFNGIWLYNDLLLLLTAYFLDKTPLVIVFIDF